MYSFLLSFLSFLSMIVQIFLFYDCCCVHCNERIKPFPSTFFSISLVKFFFVDIFSYNFLVLQINSGIYSVPILSTFVYFHPFLIYLKLSLPKSRTFSYTSFYIIVSSTLTSSRRGKKHSFQYSLF